MHALKNRIEHEMASALGLSAKIKLVEPKTIERSEGKSQRVVDNRQKV